MANFQPPVHPQQPARQPMHAQPPPKQRSLVLPLLLTGGVTAVVVGGCGLLLGTGIGAAGSTTTLAEPGSTTTVTQRADGGPAPTVTVTAPGKPASTVTAPAKPAPTVTRTVTAPPKPAPESPPAAISDGSYEVGSDIRPGRYKTVTAAQDVGNLCYVDVKDDGDIIEQELTSRGLTIIDVPKREGAIFTSKGCGDWRRTGS